GIEGGSQGPTSGQERSPSRREGSAQGQRQVGWQSHKDGKAHRSYRCAFFNGNVAAFLIGPLEASADSPPSDIARGTHQSPGESAGNSSHRTPPHVDPADKSSAPHHGRRWSKQSIAASFSADARCRPSSSE